MDINEINKNFSIIKKEYNECLKLKKPSYLLSLINYIKSSPFVFMFITVSIAIIIIMFTIKTNELIIIIFIILMEIGIILLWKAFIIDGLPNDSYSIILKKNREKIAPVLVYPTYIFFKKASIEALLALLKILETDNIDNIIRKEKEIKKVEEAKFGTLKISIKIFKIMVSTSSIILALQFFLPPEILSTESKIHIFIISVFTIFSMFLLVAPLISLILYVKNSSTSYFYSTLKYFKNVHQNNPKDLSNLVNTKAQNSVPYPSLFDFGNKN
ncbi:hypothetical protein [Francisella philomiragia]|uniref:Uncharacterized protein n=1 Tax=Francisella philomiragia TaxID=28110 RepID=A0AAW3DDA9_9GAMM|nr:hypothetical protein [Francisella philomiragia]KFJ43427.1 hypothetical protein DR78_1956 [Francisella philomiragia]MBK2255737.1 hypothetical protein [Francisella philomiragia]MBK2259583.1 hypothetical protein [Francisella philomiragia]MBK2274049.1 hypothetical protein [Francisella philomiragia]MBK2277894.1 hypothetical protein [Francisella philomiragia]